MINIDNSAADYDIEIGGIKLTDDQKLDVTECSFEEKMNNTSCFRFIIRDSDEMSLTFDDLKFGTPVKFSLGWFGAKEAIFKGSIVSISPAFKANSPAQVEVTAYDASFGMKTPRNPAFLHGKNWNQIVRDILERNKRPKDEKGKVLPAIIDDYVISHPDNVLEKRMVTDEEAELAADKTDFEVLTTIAGRTGYQVILKYGAASEENTFYFVNPDYFADTSVAGGGLFVPWTFFHMNFYLSPLDSDIDDESGLVIYSFEPELRSPGQRETVKVVSWCSASASGARYGTDQLGGMALRKDERNLTRIYIESSPIPVLTIMGEVAKTDEEANILAKAELKRRARDLVTGQVTMNGWVPLRAGQRHYFRLRTFKTFGQAFSGSYNITGVKHSFVAGKGFYTKFDVARYVVSEIPK